MDLRQNRGRLGTYIFALLLPLLVGCQNQLRAPDQISTTKNPEPTYCGSAQATTYTGSTTVVSGTASFKYRKVQLTGICTGLCGDPSTLGIPFAEIQVLNAGGSIIQCGETAADGTFSMTIPRTDGSYTVKVQSRSFTAKFKASVLEDIYSGLPYSTEKSFTISGGQATVTGVNPAASARATESAKIEGGAFNILANIYWANEFLRAQSGNASFVADKVLIYWKVGFNPYAYFNAPNTLASFYREGDALYILGGKNGDVKASDTDHFDDSVILHEYGHFLEATYGHSDSPGGSHNGNFIIDPRLAWSEGWANYFQGAVLDKVVYNSTNGPKGTSGYQHYADTLGFKSDSVEGSGSGATIIVKADLLENASGAVLDDPTVSGTSEGNFREFSVSRTLFKTLKAKGLAFSKIWESFTALASSTYSIRSFGLFNSILNSKYTGQDNTDWSSVLTEEKQVKTLATYGASLVEKTYASPTDAANDNCTTIMTPVEDRTYGYPRSNQLMSNDFYVFEHDGVAKSLFLAYSINASPAPVIDLNLYLYSADYYYSEEYSEAQAGFSNSTLLKKSKNVHLTGTTGTETVDMTGLPAGRYVVNVKAVTLNKLSSSLNNTANYYLYNTKTSKYLCP